MSEQMMDLIPLRVWHRFSIGDEERYLYEIRRNLRFGVRFKRFEIVAGQFTSSTPPFRSRENKQRVWDWVAEAGVGEYCFHRDGLVFENECDAILCVLKFA